MPGKTADDPGTELATLRRLLWGVDESRLEHLEERLDDPQIRAQETAGILADAIEVKGARDRRLKEALGPLFEESFRAVVRRNPEVIVEVLFPIMLAAIRRSVAEALRGMVESLNRILDDSVSWRGLSWRFEAMRTGRSFAEVTLSKSLLYRIDEVFLIHRDSGLILASARRGGIGRDATVVSGMLTALQDFVRDSFQVPATENLEDLKVGDTSVWVEQGSHAVIAAVIRGSPPPEYRELLQDTLALIHRDHAGEWTGFAGDPAPFEKSQPLLDNCLRAQYECPSKGAYGKLALAGGLALLILGFLLTPWAVHQWRWGQLLSLLRAEPGIVLTEEESGWTRGFVAGLRDPLATDPALLTQQAGLEPAAVRDDWELYSSYDPVIAARRNRIEMKAAFEVLQILRVPFPLGASDLSPQAYEILVRMGTLLTDLAHRSKISRIPLTIRVIGHSDESGTPQTNGRLSQLRAEAVARYLQQAYGVTISEAIGVGSTPPPGSNTGEPTRSVRIEAVAGVGNVPGQDSEDH